MNEASILKQIAALIDEEHQLRGRRAAGQLPENKEHEQLRAAEVELDQCWDLLRQRRAKTTAGQPPDEAAVRSEMVVENYWQ